MAKKYKDLSEERKRYVRECCDPKKLDLRA